MVIKEFNALDKVCLCYFTQDSLEAIRVNSGELADTCEYQTHYFALNLKKTFSDNSEFYIHIPILFFNYKQEVNGASIDFDLNDVEDVSKQLEPLAKVKAEQVYVKLKDRFEDYTPSFVSLNTLHRHP